MSIRPFRALLCLALPALVTGVALAQSTPLGTGSYYTSPPADFDRPINNNGLASLPRVSASFTGPVQTNEFWSSLIWQRSPDNAFGLPLHAHPLITQCQPTGLDVGYVRTPTVYDAGYGFDLNNSTRGFQLGVAGLNAPGVVVESASDWTVTARWDGPSGKSLRATLGHGLPFVYAQVTGGNAEIRFNPSLGPPTVWSNHTNYLGITIGGTAYALFAPTGATWSITPTLASSSLAGKDYVCVAVLPEATEAALTLFAQHAFAFVTGGQVSWAYDAANSVVNTTFTFTTTTKEGPATTPIVALYRHQWLNSTQPVLTNASGTPWTYLSPRGSMRLAAASPFVVRYPFHGVLPALPDAGALPQSQLFSLVDQVYQQGSLNSAGDTYFSGKAYSRVAQLIDLSKYAAHTAARDRFVSFLKDELADWFTVGSIGGTRKATDPIQAEWATQLQGVTVGPIAGGQGVLDLGGGDSFKIPGVTFGSGAPTRMLMRYASATTGSGLIEVRLDSLTGPVIAGGGVGGTGGTSTFVELPLGMNGSTLPLLPGTHDLYVTCSTPYPGELARIDWIKFDVPGTSTADRAFAYDANWDTILARPNSFGLNNELNDHHFHFGYFINAAAAIAREDPAWASPSSFGGMVNLLIKDAANWDRSDPRFPFLRNFDPYAGHAWASGHAAFAAGNNQESSSESMNFATGLILWGSATGDTQIRDLGIYLYAAEAASIAQYWFDADRAVFPAAVTRKLSGIVWSNGAAYATWFSGDPELIHGINFLPITGGSLYLAYRPDAILENWNLLLSQNAGPPTAWQDVLWNALATANPDLALAQLNANPVYNSEDGESAAHTQHWIRTLAQLGTLDLTVTADVPTYAVLTKNGDRTHIAWNPGAAPQTVHFSDGVNLTVPPRQIAFTGNAAPCPCAADFDASGGTPDAGDVDAFFTAWLVGDTTADADCSGGTPDAGDVDAFFIAWLAGEC
jgi:endoglucanase Acf2